MFCFGHILSDPNQKLYIPCTHLNTNDSLCAYPILRNQKSSFCSAHEGKIIQQKKRKPLEKRKRKTNQKRRKKLQNQNQKEKRRVKAKKKLRLKKWRTLITTPTSPRTFQASAAFQQLATLQIIPTTPTTPTTTTTK